MVLRTTLDNRVYGCGFQVSRYITRSREQSGILSTGKAAVSLDHLRLAIVFTDLASRIAAKPLVASKCEMERVIVGIGRVLRSNEQQVLEFILEEEAAEIKVGAQVTATRGDKLMTGSVRGKDLQVNAKS